MKRTKALIGFAVLSVALTPAACTPNANFAATPASASVAQHSLQWARVSAEHRAIYIETYRSAGDRLVALSSGRANQSWGVILDADETVLDNSEYEMGRIPFGGSFNSRAWTAWVQQGRAPALPGAVKFTARVHELGGKVVIVTNRDDVECPVTRSNLERVSITTDLVLCKIDTDDKNPRFDAVQNGSAAHGFAAITVVEWVGDNIQDFPHLSQVIRNEPDSALSRFGRVFFALPNAMYGSWQSNPFK